MPREYKKLGIDDYIITDQGDVINKHTQKKLKPQPNNKGYLRVGIGKKLMFVHRLVAEKYVPNPHRKSQVNHINGDKTDNRASNLEWVTNQENRNHAVRVGLQVSGEKCPWAKLNKTDIAFIRQHTELSPKKLSEMFGVGHRHIRGIRHGEYWKTAC